MDKKDRELLNLLQEKFPIVSRPYMAIGEKLGISEEEVIHRIGELKEKGYIRRIGGIFDSRKLGYVSTLCAMKVPVDRINETSDSINSYYGVTHNYIRNHTYNMWFTLTAPSSEKICEILRDIRVKAKNNDMLNLPSVKVFKIKAKFDMTEV